MNKSFGDYECNLAKSKVVDVDTKDLKPQNLRHPGEEVLEEIIWAACVEYSNAEKRFELITRYCRGECLLKPDEIEPVAWVAGIGVDRLRKLQADYEEQTKQTPVHPTVTHPVGNCSPEGITTTSGGDYVYAKGGGNDRNEAQ